MASFSPKYNTCDIGPGWQYSKFIDITPDGFPLQPLPVLDDLHPNTLAALDIVHDWPPHIVPHSLSIYTDGAHFQPGHDQEDAWAFVVLAEHQDTVSLVGTLYQPVANSGESCTDVDIPNSTTVELAGIIWACIWLLSRPDTTPVQIFTDASVAVGLTDRLYQSNSNHNIALLAASLLDIVKTKRHCSIVTIVEHTGSRSHTGDPWNELADAIAGHASRHHYSTLPLPAKDNIRCNTGIQWAWLDPDNSDALAYPNIDDNHFCVTNYGTTAEPIQTYNTYHAMNIMIQATFWQFNANTLAPVLHGTDDHGRFDILLAQLQQLHVLFGGFEEVRRHQFAGVIGKHYVITSDSIKGQFGMALACALEVPYYTSAKQKQ